MKCYKGWNPFPWRNGGVICECEKCKEDEMNKQAKHNAATAKYKKKFIDKYGFPFCENCGVNKTFIWSVHHIFSAGQHPGHKELHSPRNMILLCNECHDGIHLKIADRVDEFREIKEKLIKDRGLNKLFGVEL